MAVRTWAPRGQTPLLRVKLTRDHLSAISGITLDGRLFMQVRPISYDAEAVVGFLRVLLRKVPGKIILIWDGSPIHRAHEIKAFLKRVELGNVCCSNLDELSRKLIQAKERLRHNKEIIKSCSRQCGYLV